MKFSADIAGMWVPGMSQNCLNSTLKYNFCDQLKFDMTLRFFF